jgi:aryl-alcohol dehydrogenase-like predicted oxidoreductase
MEVSVLGFGSAEIGYENADQNTVQRMLGAALDAGINVIDTAECYIDSEEKIGRAVSHRRSEFWLFTKCGHAYGFKEADWDPSMLARSIDRSLRNLQTEYVDLVQLHSCSAELIERGDVIRVLQDAKAAGKARFIGYSGDTADAFAAVETGEFDSLQTSINLADQESIELTVPRARDRGMGIIAKRPIANAAWKYEEKPENSYHHEYWERLKKIDYAFLRGELSQSVATALRFTLSVEGVSVAIVGTKSEERLRENITLADPTTLPREQFDFIRQVWHERADPAWVGQV